MRRGLLLAPLVLLLVGPSRAANPLSLAVSPAGAYVLRAPSWTLTGAPLRVRVDGAWLNATDGSLVLASTSQWAGADTWGAFNATSLRWAAAAGAAADAVVLFETSFLVYADAPAVGFRAAYARGALPHGRGAPVPSVSDSDGLAAEFPAFEMDGGGADLGFLQWAGTMLNQKNDTGPYAGAWARDTVVATGRESGPAVLFDATARASLVLSPASEFMGVSAARSLDGGALAWGPLGSATEVPAGFVYDCVAWYGPGVNANVMAWGAALLARYGKPHGLSKSDFTNTHLGYSTDNGAFYYYNVGNYSNYSVALAAVHDYAVAESIPYRHVLIDSWWYYKDLPKGGVVTWTAQSQSPYFTGGNAGLRALIDATGWKVVAHNRYWSVNNTYATQNGGAWPFFMDASTDANHMAVPLSQAFWVWLLESAVRDWGLTTYEQDWLHNEFEGVSALLTNLTLARQWLLQMGAGAAAAGVSAQLCMAYPRHALESVEMPTATQIRASDDHMPGVDSARQWHLGWSAMLAWALGLAPSKDNYWSLAMQPGSTRPGPETTPSLHNAASTLSAGPVALGDGVGFSDAAQIMRACDASGRLLQPSRALTSIDAAAAARAFPASSGAGPTGVVSATYTAVGALLWDHVLAANLTAPFALYPRHLESTRADAALRTRRGGGAPSSSWLLPPSRAASSFSSPAAAEVVAVAYALNTTSLDLATLVVAPFSAAAPIALRVSGLADFELWHSAPRFANGWALLGELGKWVPVSEARFTDVGADETGAHAAVRGKAGERVALSFLAPNGTVATAACAIGDAGVATVAVSDAGTSCA